MPIETLEASRWNLDLARDAIDLERARSVQALAPGESISFVDAPQRRYTQSTSTSAERTQSQSGQTQQGGQAQQSAAATQLEPGTLTGVLDLSATQGNGGATALLAANDASATAAADSSKPTARPDQIALYELLLADPLLQELLAAYCPEAPTSLPANATADALVSQYGLDLTCRLLQASTAITRVFGDYSAAMDKAATQGPEAGGSGWVFTAGKPGQGDSDGLPDAWHFDAALFTADYAKGDSLAARAFASFHGEDGSFAQITRTLCGTSDAGDMYTLSSGGIDPDSAQFKWQDIGDGGGEMRWESARMGRNALVQIDLNEPLEMFDPKAVWFDPNLGFVTANENIVPEDSWAETVVITVIIGVATWGIGSAVCAAYGVTNAIAVGAIMGATGSIIGGLFQNGTVRFEDVVRGAITGAIMGAVSQQLDVKGIDPKTGAVTDWGARLGAITGKATIQGILAEITGGEFKDAFGQGFASGLAAEVGRSINAEINKAVASKDITAEQASAYRTLGRAATTALNALANPDGNPALASFAQDFLGDMLRAEMPSPYARVAANDSTAGQSGTANDQVNAAATQGGAQQGVITEREQQGIEQSDEILFNRGDELAEANGLNPRRLDDGSLLYPDGRIRTPGGEANTLSGQDSGPASAYPDQYRHVSVTQGVLPVGGYENLILAPDIALLPPEATPILADGRHGSSVAYRDQAGQVFYAAYDADGKAVRWLSATPAAVRVSPVVARAAGAVLTAEIASGNPIFVAAAGATLIGAGYFLLQSGGDPFASSQALPPDQVRNDGRPMINVPVSPGPSGTPGRLADNRDTSIPGQQIPDSQGPTTTTVPVTEPSWADQLIEQSAGGDSQEQQSGVLSGRRTVIGPREDADTVRSLTRENESADTLVGHGMNVEQNPTVPGEKNPDYRINGEVFDNIAPVTGNVRNIWSRAEEKVVDGQTSNVVINLRDSSATVDALAQQFANHSIPGLKTVIVIDQSGKVTIINHNGGN